ATPLRIRLRHPTRADVQRLADLMLDAYRGTIDYEGEVIEDAVREVEGWMTSPAALPEHSFIREVDGVFVSAVLVSRGATPLISYLMTAARWKGQGLAESLLRAAMRSLAAAGEERVELWVTDGNVPAERVYRNLGFTRVETREI
ncbi:MAG TPA: GNAT family N-acetyltransferase, partial [Candidatus Limnocylindrales bacterium]|nr:GNAT family N-acetyltransferase [Candidatus Limnocylindrales bacterium]